MQLIIPEDIAAEIEREASIRNLTLEDVAMGVLRARFAVNGNRRKRRNPEEESDTSERPKEEESMPKNLLEFLGDFVGCVNSKERFPKGSTAARDASKVFGEMLEEERRKRKAQRR